MLKLIKYILDHPFSFNHLIDYLPKINENLKRCSCDFGSFKSIEMIYDQIYGWQ